MPGVPDPQALRQILEADRPWAAYALADLAPQYSPYCEWHTAVGAPALLLVYRGLDPPVLFTFGAVPQVRDLLGEIAHVNCLSLSVRPEIAALLPSFGYEIEFEIKMSRMLLEGPFYPSDRSGAIRLGPADHESLLDLFRDGEPASEAPDAYDASMLAHGVYYGIHENGKLIAVAGTHVLAACESVTALGNVYTRRDRRGRGFATCVTSAVIADLLDQQVATIVLNVDRSNAGAIRVYERLGFRHYCDFREGIARR